MLRFKMDIYSALAETYYVRKGGIGILAATIRSEDTVKAFVRECGIPRSRGCGLIT
jgi:hypothetical protein